MNNKEDLLKIKEFKKYMQHKIVDMRSCSRCYKKHIAYGFLYEAFSCPYCSIVQTACKQIKLTKSMEVQCKKLISK